MPQGRTRRVAKGGKAGGPRRGGAIRLHRVAGLAQVRALAHPLRLRLLGLFGERPRTTKQAAQVLGQPPTRLYHHVAVLERAGLLRLRETRANRGTTEKYFETVASMFESPLPKSGRARTSGKDQAALGMMLFDEARNELVRALAECDADAPETLPLAMRVVGLLTPAAAARLKKDLLRMLPWLKRERVRAEKSNRKLKRYSLTIALLPTGPAIEES